MSLAEPAVHVRSYSREQSAHAHPFHQVVLPLRGGLELDVGGRLGRAAGCLCVVVPPGERHSFAGSGENRFVVLDVPEAVVRAAGALAWIDRASRDSFFVAPSRAMQLAAIAGSDPGLESSPAGVKQAWATLIIQAAAANAAGRPPRVVERAVVMLEQRALGTVRVSEVALAAGVSVGHLHALFRTHLGRTPLELVRERRLEAAHALLVGGDLPIAEVALRCGFADQASLTHAMRRLRGCTPGELRRAHSRTSRSQ